VVFFDLYNNRIKDIDFTWERALNFDGETGPYVQYTHARACSVLRKAGDFDRAGADFAALSDPFSQDVVRLIEQFPDILKSAVNRSEPSMVTRFAVDLAQAFNKFYYENKVMVDEPGTRAARLLLTDAVRQVLKQALYLIGVEAPERM
jgi:arginyl-tRNA synthetase